MSIDHKVLDIIDNQEWWKEWAGCESTEAGYLFRRT
jgi:hypothetical protein